MQCCHNKYFAFYTSLKCFIIIQPTVFICQFSTVCPIPGVSILTLSHHFHIHILGMQKKVLTLRQTQLYRLCFHLFHKLSLFSFTGVSTLAAYSFAQSGSDTVCAAVCQSASQCVSYNNKNTSCSLTPIKLKRDRLWKKKQQF